MQIIWALIYIALTLFQVLLILRIVFDVVQMFARSWRPRGLALVLASAVYRVTDPPMRWLKSKIKPLDLGGMRLDLAFIVLYIAVWVAMLIVRGLASATA
ncbi:YggT family protein [Arthrobacter ginkgonis]|uniref:YggT family protein n=1 Tax=Arthrobacter ginkgonis TaxID=1630594 RepID=A0ABP7CCD8_9MICC